MSSIGPSLLLGIGLAAAALYQLFVTVRLIKFAGYSIGQKIAQVLLIWLLPLLGAWIVHVVIRTTEKAPPAADRDFTPQGPQSVG